MIGTAQRAVPYFWPKTRILHDFLQFVAFRAKCTISQILHGCMHPCMELLFSANIVWYRESLQPSAASLRSLNHSYACWNLIIACLRHACKHVEYICELKLQTLARWEQSSHCISEMCKHALHLFSINACLWHAYVWIFNVSFVIFHVTFVWMQTKSAWNRRFSCNDKWLQR